jgi:hypothetical protein
MTDVLQPTCNSGAPLGIITFNTYNNKKIRRKKWNLSWGCFLGFLLLVSFNLNVNGVLITLNREKLGDKSTMTTQHAAHVSLCWEVADVNDCYLLTMLMCCGVDDCNVASKCRYLCCCDVFEPFNALVYWGVDLFRCFYTSTQSLPPSATESSTSTQNHIDTLINRTSAQYQHINTAAFVIESVAEIWGWVYWPLALFDAQTCALWVILLSVTECLSVSTLFWVLRHACWHCLVCVTAHRHVNASSRWH